MGAGGPSPRRGRLRGECALRRDRPLTPAPRAALSWRGSQGSTPRAAATPWGFDAPAPRAALTSPPPRPGNVRADFSTTRTGVCGLLEEQVPIADGDRRADVIGLPEHLTADNLTMGVVNGVGLVSLSEGALVLVLDIHDPLTQSALSSAHSTGRARAERHQRRRLSAQAL